MKMKFLVATLTLTLASLPMLGAESFNFNSANLSRIPLGCKIICTEGATLDTKYYRTDKYDIVNGWCPQIITEEDGTEGMDALVSCVRLTDGVLPDNWLILPVLEVMEGTGFAWTARSVGLSAQDSYDVLLSETGTNQEDFSPIAHIEKERIVDTFHFIDLSKWEGKSVHLAIRHNDASGYMLALTSLKAGVANWGYKAENIGHKFFGINDEKELTFKVTNFGGRPADDGKNDSRANFEVVRNSDRTWLGASIMINPMELGESSEIKIGLNLPEDTKEAFKYDLVAIYADGSRETLLTDYVNISDFRRKVVLEKATAVACTSCPKVTYSTHLFEHRLGVDGIYLEAHADFVNDDVFTCGDWYNSIKSCMGNDLPGVYFNRINQHESFSTQKREAYEKTMTDPCTAQVTLELLGYDYNKIHAKATIVSSEDIDNSDDFCRIAFTVAEHSVSNIVGKMGQKSNATGLSKQLYGEANFLPNPHPQEYTMFHNVVIGPDDGGIGIAGSLPEKIEAGKEYVKEWEWELPTEGRPEINPDNLMLVATLVKYTETLSASGKQVRKRAPILNADALELVKKDETGITERDLIGDFKVATSENAVNMSFDESMEYRSSLVSLSGVTVASVSGSGSTADIATISVEPGLYLLNVVTPKYSKTVKIMIK